MAAKEKSKLGVIEGTLVYAKVGQPDNKYQSTEKEWSIEVIVSEEIADEWDEQFKKQPSKKIKASDFSAKYKIDLPEHLKGEKSVYGIKLKRQATNDGEPVDESFRPKIYIDDADGNRTECGQSRLIANGSFGKVSYFISTNDFGTFSRLQNVLMKEEDFIEYESKSSGGGSEFGEAKSVKYEEPKESVMKTRAEKPAPKKVVEQDDISEETEPSPF
jgi:hypothetical protein